MKRIAFALVMACLAAITPAMARKAKVHAPTLPAYFALPSTFTIAEGGSGVTFEDFGEATFWEGPDKQTSFNKQGKHWHAPLALKNPPSDLDGKGTWAVLKPALVAVGWTIPQEYDSNPFSAMMRYQQGGHDVWGFIEIYGPGNMSLDLVDAGGGALDFVITPPAAIPERFDVKKQNFPYLPPLPGTSPGTGAADSGPMEVTLPDSGEVQLVGNGTKTRFYPNPPTLSTLAFVNTYVGGLTRAGWTVIDSVHGSDAAITAHYARNGRDLWTYMHMGGEGYSIKVADSGTESDLAKQFAKACHVTLLGVLFDFNKATLKPESDPVLERVLAFLRKAPGMKLEVQGHTDNVGGDDYNLKLSDARSKSVLTWLTEHGIKIDRLSFKGYGKTRPIATNDTDEGRAKNRRVEIARPGCTKDGSL
jgi:outer membrane protein OmpA-like peptidoglycan-associated protein